MKMADKKERARAFFVKSTLNRKEIAEAVGVTEKTLRNWIESENWQEEKDSQSITRMQLLQESYRQLKAINDDIRDNYNGVPSKNLADAKAMIRKEIDSLSRQPIYRYVEVFEEFLIFVSKNNPPLVEPFSKVSMNFISELQKEK